MIAWDEIDQSARWLRGTLYSFGLRGLLLDGLLAFVAVFVVANFALANGGLMSFVWRREMALIQDRYGPNRVGPQGLLQFLADGIKMILKQAMVPRAADRLLFIVAPVLAVFPFVMAYLVIPFSHGGTLADVNVGVLYLFAITSLAFPSVLFLAGWASNNKYAMIGGMRAVAQLLAFEVPLTMSALGVVLLAGSLSTGGLVSAQHNLWFIVPQVLGAAIFFIAGMAENAAHPFDLPEAESRSWRVTTPSTRGSCSASSSWPSWARHGRWARSSPPSSSAAGSPSSSGRSHHWSGSWPRPT